MENIGRIIGRYQIQKRLGSGGFGEVFLAKDTINDNFVAIKALLSIYSADPQFRHRFLTEGQALARLKHPHIVDLLEIKEDDSGIYIIMDYIEGESLGSMLRNGPLEVSRALALMIHIGEALEKAHGEGIVHRDIKPENIIIHAQRGAVLLDFGLARLSGNATVTRAGQIMGTWKYMSPEQLRGETSDHRADIFSLGIVLYESLVGVRPFGGEYDAAVVYSILHDEPRAFSNEDLRIPQSIQGVIARALRKDTSERYQSVIDLTEDLRRISAGREPIFAKITESTKALPQSATLAILYLRSQCSQEYEYLPYGITEDLIIELSQIPQLKVAPMRAVLPFQKSTSNLQSIAMELNVRYIFDGSLSYLDDLLVVIAQLIDAHSNELLWSVRWEGKQNTLVELRKMLSDGILGALNLIRQTENRAEIGRVDRIPDPVAYEYYLRAKYLFEHKKSAADVEIAAGLYTQALQKEPLLLSASLGLARIHIHQGDNQNAIGELDSALKQSQQMRLQAVETEIKISLSEAHFRLGEWDRAFSHASDARELSKSSGDLSTEARALTILIDILEPQAKYEEAMSLYQRVVQINQQLRRKDKIAAAIKSIAVIYHRRGQYSKALHHYEEALELCRSQDLIDLEAKILNNVGLIQLHLDDCDAAQSHFERALELHRELGEPASYAVNLNNLGVVQHTKGEYESALVHFRDAARAAEDVGDLKNLALALENQGKAHVMLGEYLEAESKSVQAREIASRLNYQLIMVTSERNLGDLDLYQSRHAEAERHFIQGLKLAEQADLRNEQFIVLISQAKMFEQTHDYGNCLSKAGLALGLARQLQLRRQALLAASYRAYCKLMIARDHRFLQKLIFLVGRIDQRFEPQHAIVMRRLLGQALLEFGTSKDAILQGQGFLAQALATAVKHKIKFEQSWIEEVIDRNLHN